MESHSRGEAGKTSIVFSPLDPNAAGTLAKFLKIFDEFAVDLTHIESRSSTRGPGNKN
jgi:phenylalanine-4-hydroxylase